MDVTNLKSEGYRLIHDRERKGISGKTAEFIDVIRYRGKDKADKIRAFEESMRMAVENPGGSDQEKMSLDELEKQPLFEMSGFDGEPPDYYEPGTEPAFAPLSKEQMRLLLLRTIPTDLVPFALERFAFQYEAIDDDDPEAGPSVQVKKDRSGQEKVVITFNRNHFFSDGAPPTEFGKTEQELREDGAPKAVAEFVAEKHFIRTHKIDGFIDPSKISVFMGKIIAKMLPQPEQWRDWSDPSFRLTHDKQSLKSKLQESLQRATRSGALKIAERIPLTGEKASKALDLKSRGKDELQKQWEDYIALSITAPELAQQRYPKAYEYFSDQIKKFNDDPSEDAKALERIGDAAADQGGKLRLANIEKMADMRTPQEKMQAKGHNPNLAWYEQWIMNINKGLSTLRQVPLLSKMPIIGNIVNMKIIYNIPEDAARAEQLAGDDKKIKELIELIDEKVRDEEFGELLANSDDFDEKARNEARRYLLAYSQVGEFAEWRTHAWLYKFSKTFRQWQGQYIDEEDYKDLQLIHSQSEKVGNRLGTGVLPYEPTKFESPDAQHIGRRAFLYARKDRSSYVKEVEKKIRNKSLSALTSGSDKAFDQFKGEGGYFDLDEKYAATPEGMRTQSGNLEEYLGRDLAPEVARWLNNLGIGKIPPDARAVAIKYYDEYIQANRQSDRYVSPKAFEVVNHFKAQLNHPAEDVVKEIMKESAKDLANSGDFERIKARVDADENAANLILQSLGAELDQGHYSEIIPSDIRKQILFFISEGETEVDSLLQSIEPSLLQFYPLVGKDDDEKRRNAPERDQNLAKIRRNIIRFMYDPKTIKNLILLEKVQKDSEIVQPPFVKNIAKAAAFLAGKEPAELIKVAVNEQVKHEELEAYAKLGVKFDQKDYQRIKEAGNVGTGDAAMGAGINYGPDQGPDNKAEFDEKADTEPKNKMRAIILAEKLSAADQETREYIVAQSVAQGLAHLKTALFFPEATNDQGQRIIATSSYRDRYRFWYDSPVASLFKTPALRPVLGEISLAVIETDSLRTQAKGVMKLSEIIDRLSRAVNYEAARQKPTKKQEKPQEPKAEEVDEEKEKKAA